MSEIYKFTNEAKAVFNYIKKELVPNFPSETIDGRYYIYSILCNKECAAYKALEKILFGENITAMEDECHSHLVSAPKLITETSKYHPIYDKSLADCGSNGKTIDTCSFLVSMINNDKEMERFMNRFGVTVGELQESTNQTAEDKSETTAKVKLPKKTKSPQPVPKKTTPRPKQTYNATEVEKNLADISRMAEEGLIDPAIGNDSVINRIFTALLKRDRNNVILVGEPGSGKTCTVQHIANMINEGCVPKYFSGKRLVRMDFIPLLSGTGMRGGFEGKYQTIVDAASKSGKYIFFIDDIHSILSSNSKFSEVSTDSMLETILNNKRIMVIATTTFEGYSKFISSNKTLERRFEKITIDEKKGEGLFKIVKAVSTKYETYHHVAYSDDIIEKSIDLSERYLGGAKIYTVSDILDEAAADELMRHGNDKKLDALQAELADIEGQMETFKTESNSYDEYDELCRKQIEKRSEINRYEKERNLSKPVLSVRLDSLYKVVSERTGIPVGTIGSSERERLKKMEEHITEKVIGQDDAVGSVCRSVRRHRVGIANPSKPNVFLYVGKSGTGKTYLAKKLAEEVFGDEKKMVRLDMSEYADKISANKLIGAAHGYVGYEEGGILTEAIKKNNHCVLLLDEIEKANEEIFNMFLQVFDEGRLTDNKGITVDFRNVIIIMTSNIGTKEASEYKGPIGFGERDESVESRDIIMKNIKKKLPPEFINRIDEIVFFNTLTDDNLKEIIAIEIGKIEDRVKKLGFGFDKSITDGRLLNNIFTEVKKESEYGARPILREIQRQLEDKLTDFLLDKDVKKGYKFKFKDIYQEK